MNAIVGAFLVSALALVAAPASAKSQTIKLEIVGPGLRAPLEITDRAILDRFSIWSGPGTARQLAQRDPGAVQRSGAYADWLRGSLQQPAGLQMYTVTFHQGGREPMHEWHRTYEITYGLDQASGTGYIYLPGPKDGERYWRNVFSISHGGQGKWFHASPAWERSVLPLIQQRIAKDASNSRSREQVASSPD